MPVMDAPQCCGPKAEPYRSNVLLICILHSFSNFNAYIVDDEQDCDPLEYHDAPEYSHIQSTLRRRHGMLRILTDVVVLSQSVSSGSILSKLLHDGAGLSRMTSMQHALLHSAGAFRPLAAMRVHIPIYTFPCWKVMSLHRRSVHSAGMPSPARFFQRRKEAFITPIA